MTKYSKLNIVYRLQKWMDSVPGQTFLNYAYSWGAAIVILGTLFKLTHLPGANLMLFAGMGTEVFVFFLSAFDRPFDKTADGRELLLHADDEEPLLPSQQKTMASTKVAIQETLRQTVEEIKKENLKTTVTEPSTAQTTHIPETAQVIAATDQYVTQLNELTEVLKQVQHQSQRLTTDSEEMENLNRTLTGICKVYEMQLKSAGQQIGTIDQINEQSKRMAQLIEQLNQIYTRMIEAMSININPMQANNLDRQNM